MVAYCLKRDSDDDFWQASFFAKLDELEVRIPSAADHLLHTMVHGTPWDHDSPIRWIPDAITLIRNNSNLDWEQLARQTIKRKLQAMVLPSLLHLRGEFEAPVPDEVVRSLASVRVPFSQRVEYKSYIEPQDTVWRKAVFYWCRACRAAEGASLFAQPRRMMIAICTRLRLSSSLEIPFWAWSQMKRRIGKRLRNRYASVKQSM
jgi:hypothetical protein